MGNVFASTKFVVNIPGPVRKLRPRFPIIPAAFDVFGAESGAPGILNGVGYALEVGDGPVQPDHR